MLVSALIIFPLFGVLQPFRIESCWVGGAYCARGLHHYRAGYGLIAGASAPTLGQAIREAGATNMAESAEALSGVSPESLIPAARGSSKVDAVHRGVASPPSATDVLGDRHRQVGMNANQSGLGMSSYRLDDACPPISTLRDVASVPPPLHEDIPGTADPLQSPACHWSCAEASLTRNLGLGTYEFGVQGLEMHAAAFEMLTCDYAGGALRNREMNIEISRWDAPVKEDARYLLQPYYVTANGHRFNEPAGTPTEVAP